MDDLDSLLEDLGSDSSAPPSRPISSRVDLNELESLMVDLAAPSTRASIQSRDSRPSIPDVNVDYNSQASQQGDLDALLNSLTPEMSQPQMDEPAPVSYSSNSRDSSQKQDIFDMIQGNSSGSQTDNYHY